MTGSLFIRLHNAEQIADRLEGIVRSLGPQSHARIFYSRVRVKQISSIKEKIYRKRTIEGKQNYGPGDLTDIVGLRLVVLFDDDLTSAFDAVLQIIEIGSNSREPIFFGETPFDCLREAKIYHRSDMKIDKTEIYQKFYNYVFEKAKEYFAGSKEIEKRLEDLEQKVDYGPAQETMYSSAHFIFQAQPFAADPKSTIPLEVQVRTASEDIWSEINHRLLYKARDYFVWTPPIAEKFRDLDADSAAFKSAIEALSLSVSRFIENAQKAKNLTREFPSAERHFHRSAICGLYFAMSGEYLQKDTIGLFDQYDKIISDMRTAYLNRRRDPYSSIELLKLFKSAKSVCRQILKIEEQKRDRADTPDRIDLCNARLALIDLEEARLTILDEDLRARSAGRSNGGGETEHKTRRHRLQMAVGRLHRFLDDDRAKLKPISVVTYWKYYGLKEYWPEQAIELLRQAREQCQFDSAMPAENIYRFLIPFFPWDCFA